MKFKILLFSASQLILALSYLLGATLSGKGFSLTLADHFPQNFLLWVIFLITGILFGKFHIKKMVRIRRSIRPVLYANITYVTLVSLYVVLWSQNGITTRFFYPTLLITTVGELLLAIITSYFKKAQTKGFYHEYETTTPRVVEEPTTKPVTEKPSPDVDVDEDSPCFTTIDKQLIRTSELEKAGKGARQYLKQHVPMDDSTLVVSVNCRLEILTLPTGEVNTIVNLQRVNDHRYVNKFLEAVNAKLERGDLYVGVAETKEMRKKRFFKRYSAPVGFVLYTIDFFCSRVAPKLPVLKRLYFCCTSGKNRVMSRAEILGRLYSCGFEVLNESSAHDRLFFTARKIREPYFDMNPTYGPLIRLRRVGKNGRQIGVYKFRTMHPYAEYLQPYIHKKNNLQKGGKFSNDFRISTTGKIMRKLWIDELPMLVNWLKGELKLVGVRPLSEHYFNLYKPELRKKRTRHKPGLVPPIMPTCR